MGSPTDLLPVRQARSRELDDWIRTALMLAKRCACREGLTRDDADDCATELIVRLLRQYKPQELLSAPVFTTPAWLYRCARNQAIDYRRAQVRLRRLEYGSTEAGPSERIWRLPEIADAAGRPDLTFLRAHCLRQLASGIAQLPRAQREVLVRHHLQGESVAELAAALRRSPHAVEQLLLRARHRLRSVLERRGWSETELKDWLAASQAATPGRCEEAQFSP
jgi:RNA polymerase sigma-70 factor, ECF subfamily